MSRHAVFTESKAGGDRVYLGTLAKITGLQWTWTWPGGSQSAQFNLLADSRYSHRALTLGRTLTVMCGASKAWTGILTKPGRGNPWQVQADGNAATANNYLCIPGASGNPLNLNEGIDGAISRGLPWTSRPDLPTGFGDQFSMAGSGSFGTVSATLSSVLPESNLTWTVDTYGNLTDPAPPTGAPSYLFLTADPAGGRTLDNYVTAYLVAYNSAASGHTVLVWVRNTAAEALFPPVEQTLDVTGRGLLTSTEAIALGNAQLSMTGPRAPWASSLVFARGMIRNKWGSIVDPATVRPPCLGRMLLVDPDHPAETSYAAATDFWVGQTTYDDDTDTLTVSPLDLSKAGLFESMTGGV